MTDIMLDPFTVFVKKRCFYQNGETSLHWAAKHNTVEMASLLLEKGADIHAADRVQVDLKCWLDFITRIYLFQSGKTPFQRASQKNHTKMMTFLSDAVLPVSSATATSMIVAPQPMVASRGKALQCTQYFFFLSLSYSRNRWCTST